MCTPGLDSVPLVRGRRPLLSALTALAKLWEVEYLLQAPNIDCFSFKVTSSGPKASKITRILLYTPCELKNSSETLSVSIDKYQIPVKKLLLTHSLRYNICMKLKQNKGKYNQILIADRFARSIKIKFPNIMHNIRRSTWILITSHTIRPRRWPSLFTSKKHRVLDILFWVAKSKKALEH